METDGEGPRPGLGRCEGGCGAAREGTKPAEAAAAPEGFAATPIGGGMVGGLEGAGRELP